MKTLSFALAVVLVGAAGCASSPVTAPQLQSQMITYNGQARIVMGDPIATLKPGDEVLIRYRGTNAVAVVASQRGPGVYRLRNFEVNFLTADNYAGRLFNAEKAWAEAQAAKAAGKPEPTTALIPELSSNRAPVVAAISAVPPATVPIPKVEALATVVSSRPAPNDKPADFHEDLVRLDDLRKKGILTEAEFQLAKERVLNRLK
jgi:hypothetical protein